ncbi:MAG TPA: c-type cytochrome [Casimicrobiaceae bacterium]|nr:c-type cytochrome [Casimicrobiaceae bacterium]
MKRILRYAAWALAAVVAVALAACFWAYQVAMSRYETKWTTHAADFPIPFPLREDELAALSAERVAGGATASDPLRGVDPQALALARAVRRGEHLVDSRTGCKGCHGQDLGGATIIDAALVGRWVAPNLTTGAGSVTRDFTASDWDRAVRHGVRHNGLTSSMPVVDFVNLSDHELSDIVAYIRSLPPVNRDMGAVKLGPVFAFLIATDPNALGAFKIDHDKAHPVEPPPDVQSAELGRHIVQVCRGCHGENLSGGKLAGDPDMPIVANLTPHETGLKGWTEADFLRAIREGKRKDGTDISRMMPWQAYARMSDTELKSIWAYLQTVPPREKGNH